jgi:replicative DNA helicase
VNNLEDIAAERAVLAGLCTYGNDAFSDISDIVSSALFANNSNQIIFNCIHNAINKSDNIDIASVLASASELGLSDFITKEEEIRYLRSLFNFPIRIENVRVHALKIYKLYIAKKLQFTVKGVYDSLHKLGGSESMDHILGLAEKPILDFANDISQGQESPVLIGEGIDEYISYVTENGGNSIGIPSGFSNYDRYIGGGFRRGTISLVTARLKVGKSVLADNIAIHVAHRLKIPILMIDTEMKTNDHHARLLAYFSKIPINDIESGKFAEDPILRDKISKAAAKIKDMPYTYKNVSGKPFNEILSIIHRWIHRTVGIDNEGNRNHCLVIYDYFKLMTTEAISNNIAEYQALGFQISEFHNHCVKYDYPVFSLVQSNRQGIDKESSDIISQSDRLAQLATNCSIFKTKTDEEIAEDGAEWGNRKLIPIIARHGPGIEMGNYINVDMQGEFAMINELRTKFDVNKNTDSFESED